MASVGMAELVLLFLLGLGPAALGFLLFLAGTAPAPRALPLPEPPAIHAPAPAPENVALAPLPRAPRG